MDCLVIKGGASLKGEVKISGAKNAALLAVQILALSDPALAKAMRDWRAAQTANVAVSPQ